MRKHKILWISLLVLIITLAACSDSASKEVDSEQKKDANDGPPSVSDLDPDDELTPFIKEGESLLNGTHESSDESENKLSCMSCHADGSGSGGVSLVGVTSEYPKYDERKDVVLTLEEKVNDSFTRVLNTDKMDYDEEEMRSIIAYLTYISDGIKVGEGIIGNENITKVEEIPDPDLDNGEKIYDEKLKDSTPDLWGKHSFTDGSYLTRMSVMTNYVKNYLPEDDPGSFSDQEAADVAAYILSKDRPEWDGDDSDWPDGKPNDFINEKERRAIEDGDFDWPQVNDD